MTCIEIRENCKGHTVEDMLTTIEQAATGIGETPPPPDLDEREQVITALVAEIKAVLYAGPDIVF